MEVIVSFFILIAFLGTVYPMRDVPKETMEIYTGMSGVEHVPLDFQVVPFTEFNDKNIVKQEYDYSCGSAALASLLNYYLGERLTEQQVIQGLMQYGDAKKIEERRAFSLLDMKRFSEVLGYKAAGYKAEMGDLKALKKPAIVPIEMYGYKHFVVFRGIYGDHVFVADPYMGNTSYSLKRFTEMWNPAIVFVVSDGDLEANALMLTDEDLRIIDYDLTKNAVTQTLPDEFVKKQRQFKESLGGIFIRSVK